MARVVRERPTTLVRKIRDFILRYDYNDMHRYRAQIASRSPDAPHLPEGPSHKLSVNAYYARDARREVQPPTSIYVAPSSVPQLTSGASPATAVNLKTPSASPYRWDEPTTAEIPHRQ